MSSSGHSCYVGWRSRHPAAPRGGASQARGRARRDGAHQPGLRAYCIKRGWTKEVPIKPQSCIDIPGPDATLQAGSVSVSGVAWASTGGIDRVEVLADSEDLARPPARRPARRGRLAPVRLRLGRRVRRTHPQGPPHRRRGLGPGRGGGRGGGCPHPLRQSYRRGHRHLRHPWKKSINAPMRCYPAPSKGEKRVGQDLVALQDRRGRNAPPWQPTRGRGRRLRCWPRG